jgi:hypothetical protein
MVLFPLLRKRLAVEESAAADILQVVENPGRILFESSAFFILLLPWKLLAVLRTFLHPCFACANLLDSDLVAQEKEVSDSTCLCYRAVYQDAH